jgi:diguanylate cyclase
MHDKAPLDAATQAASADLLNAMPVPYVEADTQGTIIRVNSVACKAFGLSCDEFVGRSAWEFLAGDQVKCSQEEFQRALASADDPPPIRRSIRSEAGQFRTYDLFRSVIRDIHGNAHGMRHIAVDVTEAVLAHEEAEQTRAWLESVLDSLGEAVILTDALGFVRSINPAGEALTGWSSRELLGKAIEKAMPILSYEPADEVALSHHAMLEGRLRGAAVILDRKRYQLRVEMESSPILDKQSGFTAGIVRVLRPLGEN